jgi:molybdopterin-guanine dinucleotide biosynthesis protein A
VSSPLGVILAGGAGRRMGGEKTLVEIDSRPLLRYPLDVLREVLDEVVIVCKEDSVLPDLPPQVAIWCEPDERLHPLVGVACALRGASGRSVLVCAADMPLITPATIAALLAAPPADAPAVVGHGAGRLQPLLARYGPAALGVLEAMDPAESAVAVIERLDPVRVELSDEDVFNVNAPEDVLQASALLANRR